MLASAAPARGNDLVIKDGLGEEIVINDGSFGKKTRMLKDRLGNKYEQKKGRFGGGQTEINFLGNQLKTKRGWFGDTDLEGTTILGDRITSERDWLGRRKITIDLKGVSSLVKSFVNSSGQKRLPELKEPSGGGEPGLLSPYGNYDWLDGRDRGAQSN